MILKLKKYNYKYKIFLSLANKDIRMKDIEDEIKECVQEYNIYARTSTKNKKRISNPPQINESEDLLIVILESENPLPIPVRGIKYFTQLLIKKLEKNKKTLLDEILKKKAFFRTVEIEEIKEKDIKKSDENVHLEKKIENEVPQSNIEELLEVHQIISEILFNENSIEKTKVKKEILRIVNDYKKE